VSVFAREHQGAMHARRRVRSRLAGKIYLPETGRDDTATAATVRYAGRVPVLGQSIHADEAAVAFILEKYAS
jgi:hypothetical protein